MTTGLGPISHATLQCADAAGLADLYRRHLQLTVHSRTEISARTADVLGARQWAGAPCLWLGPAGAKPWLRIVECAGQQPPVPLRRLGWMSLEIAVQDVDQLALKLAASPFQALGQPANLAVSDAIRAMQVAGPAGEVLYLTEIKDEVPPFELPRAAHPVDSLFIAVLACADRAVSSAFYHRLGGGQPLAFDTRIGVLNRAWQQPDQKEYPVATVQLAAKTLLEIDALPQAEPLSASAPPAGIASVGMETDRLDGSLPWLAPAEPLPDYPWQGRAGGCIRGPDGERIELVHKG